MKASDCISITELKKSPTKVLNDLKTDKIKYIFSNNKPKAMIIDIDYCEENGIGQENFVEFGELDLDSLPKATQDEIIEARKMDSSEFIKC